MYLLYRVCMREKREEQVIKLGLILLISPYSLCKLRLNYYFCLINCLPTKFAIVFTKILKFSGTLPMWKTILAYVET